MGRAIEDMREMWGFDHELPPAPDRLLNEGDVVAFGDVELQVVATPGHTPGGIVLFCAAATGDVAFVGDTLFPVRTAAPTWRAVRRSRLSIRSARSERSCPRIPCA